MSFLNADLPSSDEEDDDYRPEQDKTAPKEDLADLDAPQHGRGDKRPRGPGDQHDITVEELEANDQYDPRKKAKKAKIDHLWLLLNSKPGSAPPPPQPRSTCNTPMPSTTDSKAPPTVGPSAAVSLATLCRTVGAKERKKTDTDALWMRSLGLTPSRGTPATPSTQPSPRVSLSQQAASGADGTGPSQAQTAAATAAAAGTAAQEAAAAGTSGEGAAAPAAGPSNGVTPVSESARAMAAAALAAVREGGSLGAVRAANKVTVTETRRFAGKDIQVAVQLDRGSKEAAKAAERANKPPPPTSGLDAFLSEIEKKKKVNVLDKTKADWQQLKASDVTLEEELEAHKRSGGQYLEKVDFLKRAEVREYEAERDKRLASDVRNRGRM